MIKIAYNYYSQQFIYRTVLGERYLVTFALYRLKSICLSSVTLLHPAPRAEG